MLPGPTNVPERVTRAMITPSINHRSDDFVELYEECVNNTKKIFETEGDAVCLSASGTGAVECSVVNLVKKGDKVIVPVNGEFSSRLAQQMSSKKILKKWGGVYPLGMDLACQTQRAKSNTPLPLARYLLDAETARVIEKKVKKSI